MTRLHQRIFYLLAHTDDEIGAVLKMRADLAAGHDVFALWLTAGVKEFRPERIDESNAAMDTIGLPRQNRIFHQAIESTLMEDPGVLIGKIRSLLTEIGPDAVFAPAWEAGHVDHDFSHFVAAQAIEELGTHIPLYEFPLYNFYGFKIRVLELLPGPGEIETVSSPADSQSVLQHIVAAHHSQRFHLNLWRWFVNEGRLIARGQTFRRVAGYDYTQPAHRGIKMVDFLKRRRYQQFLKLVREYKPVD